LGFNGGQGPFRDVRLRQAVAHAIRREEIVKAAFYGRGRPLEGMPIQSTSPYYDAGRAKTWTYNPARAKALMAEAGVPNGFSCTLLSTGQYGMHQSTAEVVQAHLGEIGIQVKLNLPDWATRVDLGNKGQYEFCVQGTTADNNDPDGLAPILNGQLPMSVARSANLPTPEIDEFFKQGRAELDPVKRKAVYAQLEKKALEQASLVGLAWRSQGYGMVRGLSGFKSLPGGTNFFSGYLLEEAAFSAAG
jgi:ABC-type transport system substrate-binding protein